MSITDTICAMITAPGSAAIGAVRLSGAQAVELAKKIYKGGADLETAPTHTIHYGWVVDPADGTAVDEALFLLMRGPKSYTGEDVVEIQCHGGYAAVQEILKLLLRLGAEPASAGEFTKRAFINGKLDLTRAEAIMDIVDAKSEAALKLAVGQKSGALEKKVRALREEILECIAYIQADLDYPEDDIERLEDSELEDRIDALVQVLEGLTQAAERGRIYREGMRMAICGRPNVGKSSLLNALSGRERAIVTDIAGTTRDIVTEALSIRGVPVELLDTAGIRETDDAIEAIGVERAREVAAEADLILYVADASVGLTEGDLAELEALDGGRTLLVVNKLDKNNAPAIDGEYIGVSAKLGEGIEALEDAIFERVVAQSKREGSEDAISNVRHLAIFEECLGLAKSFIEGLQFGMSKDILVIDLQNMWEGLGLVTGETASEDLLDTIFSKFCLGK